MFHNTFFFCMLKKSTNLMKTETKLTIFKMEKNKLGNLCSLSNVYNVPIQIVGIPKFIVFLKAITWGIWIPIIRN